MRVHYFGWANLVITIAAAVVGAALAALFLPWWMAVAAGVLTLVFAFPGHSLTVRSHSLVWKGGAQVLRRIIYLGDLDSIKTARPPYTGIDSRALYIATYLSDIACPGIVLLKERTGRITPFCFPEPETLAAELERRRTAAAATSLEAAARIFRRAYEGRERALAAAFFAAFGFSVTYYHRETVLALGFAIVCVFMLVRALYQHRQVIRSSASPAA